MRFAPVLCLAILCAAACAPSYSGKTPPRVKAGVLDLRQWDFHRDGPVYLDGHWHFYPGRLSGGMAPPDDVAPRRQVVPGIWTSGNPFKDSAGISPTRYGIYELRILLNRPPGNPGLKFLDSGTASVVYINGNAVLRDGRVGRDAKSSVPASHPRIVPVRLSAGENRMLVDISDFHYGPGGLWERIALGEAKHLNAMRNRRNFETFFLAGCFLLMGIYHLGLFRFRRGEMFYFYFGAFCIAQTLRLFVVEERVILDPAPALSWSFLYRADFSLGALTVFMLAGFQYNLFPRDNSRIVTRIFQGLLATCVLYALFAPVNLFSRVVTPLLLLVIAWSVWATCTLMLALSRKRAGIFIALPGWLVLLVTIMHDVYYAAFPSEGRYLLPFGLLVFIFIQAYNLARGFNQSRRTTEEMARSLEEANTRLLSLDKLKDDFLANTSHELRTPLQGIIGLTDGLRAGASVPEHHRRQLDLIIAGARRLSRLVNDILDFSRLRNQDVSVNAGSVDLFALAEVSLELARVHGTDKDLELVNEIPADRPRVRADGDRLQQVLDNLLHNAVKFTDRGRVTVSATPLENGLVEIAVRDTGVGIPAEGQAKIFEPFEQGPRDYSRPAGTGLGLSIARSLVRLHGGELKVDSRPGEGTRFYFQLPVIEKGEDAKLFTAHRENPPPPPRDETPADSHEQLPRGTGTRILIVDDEKTNRQVMTNYLSGPEYSVFTAADGREALDFLERDPATDLILLDVMLPRLSGFDTARMIREEYSGAEPAIIMVTARNSRADIIAALRAGANDYITKPFEKEEFLLRVEQVLGLRRAQEAKARAARERRNALRNLRRRINADLHDHLGGKLTDLKFMTRELARAAPAGERMAEAAGRLEEIQRTVQQTIELLRDQMLNLEDLNMLADDFPGGINVILLRRYVGAGRILFFRSDEKLIPLMRAGLDESGLLELYSIIQEVATNDLKYGSGDSLWSFDLTGDPEAERGRLLRIRMLAETGTESDGPSGGRGDANIRHRVEKLKGTLIMRERSGRFLLKLKVPLA